MAHRGEYARSRIIIDRDLQYLFSILPVQSLCKVPRDPEMNKKQALLSSCSQSRAKSLTCWQTRARVWSGQSWGLSRVCGAPGGQEPEVRTLTAVLGINICA